MASDSTAARRTDPARIARATIPVEWIKAPILPVSGTDDRTWPATDLSREIVAKLKKAGFPHEAKHVANENGGHASFLPWLITANRGSGGIDGGTSQANVQGEYRSWTERTSPNVGSATARRPSSSQRRPNCTRPFCVQWL